MCNLVANSLSIFTLKNISQNLFFSCNNFLKKLKKVFFIVKENAKTSFIYFHFIYFWIFI